MGKSICFEKKLWAELSAPIKERFDIFASIKQKQKHAIKWCWVFKIIPLKNQRDVGKHCYHPRRWPAWCQQTDPWIGSREVDGRGHWGPLEHFQEKLISWLLWIYSPSQQLCVQESPRGNHTACNFKFPGWFLSSRTQIHPSGGPCQQRITSWFPRAVRYCVCTSQTDFPWRTGGAFLVLLSFDKGVIKMLTSLEMFPGW